LVFVAVSAVHLTAGRTYDLRLYMDVLPEKDEVRCLLELGLDCSPTYLQRFPDTNSDTLVIFLKCFDASKQSLHGIGKVYVQRSMKITYLTGLITERLRWLPNTQLKFFGEVKPGMIEVMETETTFAQIKTQNGDIICFQVEIPELE
jgi:ubiquitin carboxyl-terminal hydrolase 7